MRGVRQFIAVIAISASLLPSAVVAQEAGAQPTIAVMAFEATPSGRTMPPPQLGATAAMLMIDQLVASERYRVLDGRWLMRGHYKELPELELLREAALREGVDYLVLGEITRFTTERRGRSIGGLGFVKVPVLGGYRRRSERMAVSVMSTIVDVRTGEIRSSSIGEGTSERTLRRLGLIGLPGGGGGGSDASGYYDSLLDEATQQAVISASRGIVNAATRLRTQRAATVAVVAAVDAVQ